MKILVIDDHPLFREGLRYVLGDLADDIQLLEASTSDESKEILQQNMDIDLVLVDLNMPGDTGFSVLEHCRIQHSTLPLVVISASRLKQDIQQAMDMGAMGYIPKDTSSKAMVNILQVVLAGGLYFPQINLNNHKFLFTPRQSQVLSLMVEGLSNKNIAGNMGITEATIKMHVTAILKILGVTNRTQAALTAMTQGLVIEPLLL
jgi:DNA-binding NarL/FixJ family response regulator